MRQAKKIFSVMLAAVMLLSVWSITAFAELGETKVSAEVVATPAGQTSSGLNIYEIGVYVDSTHSLSTLQLNLSYDSSAFQLMRSNKTNDAALVNANMVIVKTDPELAMYDGDIYTAYEGGFMDYGANPKYGYAMFPNDGTAPTIAKISDGNLGETLLDAGYTGLYWAWMVDYTDNYLLLSGADERNTEAINGGENFTAHSPIGGRVKVLTFYLREKEGAEPGEYMVGFNADQTDRLTGTYTVHNDMDSVISSGVTNSKSIQKSMVTYKNAEITIGEAGPVVAKSKAEVKMTPNSPTTVEDAFQFRVTSVITDADWDTYFSNTAAGGNNAITKLGFVAYKGTAGFDLETAKSVAKGGTAAGYDKAETTYVQKETDSSDAYFGAIIQITSAETRSDATYIAYVEYTDAEGATQYAFYDAAQTALLDTNYQAIVNAYLAAHPFSVG